VLSEPVVAPAGAFEVRLLRPDDELADVMAAVHAAFAGTDVVDPTPATRHPAMMRAGLLAVAGAYDGRGAVVGGGSQARGVDTVFLAARTKP
jgi:hypothetical protein